MSTVDPLFAQWLQAQASFVVSANAAGQARWGATGVTSERVTGIANLADATAEADRQLAFFGRGPFAVDVHQVKGTDWHAELGQIVTLTSDKLGYELGVDVLVFAVDVDRASGLAELTVLRPLNDARVAAWSDVGAWNDNLAWTDAA